MNFCKQANAKASLLKLSVRKGAQSESRPVLYVYIIYFSIFIAVAVVDSLIYHIIAIIVVTLPIDPFFI